MTNRNSSYYKLFRYALIVVVSVLIIVGVVIISICSSVYKNSRLNDHKTLGELFSGCIETEFANSGSSECIKNSMGLMRRFSVMYDVEIYVYNGDSGNVIMDSTGKAPAYNSSKIQNALSIIDSTGSILSADSASFSESEPKMVYGTYLTLSPNDKLYIFLYGKNSQINSFTQTVMAIYILFGMLGVLLIYLMLKRRVRKHITYENEILRITELYSKGDFSDKISTDMPGNLGDIAACINSVAADVEKSEESSKTFIANVSHELRTPMTTIGGFVDGILDGTIKKSRQTEYLVLVSNEIKRLRILISSMLNMTKFESGTMRPNFKETNITDLVIQVVLMFEKKIEEKKLEIEELDSSRLMAVVDADLMQQVIYNLVENAVKFVNVGGMLSFRFEKQGSTCIIGIRNTGEGLKDEEIKQVFDRFYKTDSSRGKDTTGLGLGLSISRKIVHLHKGHIVVKSVYGEYTEFQIQIPEDPTKA